MSTIPGVDAPIRIHSEQLSAVGFMLTLLYYAVVWVVANPVDSWLYMVSIAIVWINTILALTTIGIATLSTRIEDSIIISVAKEGNVPYLIRYKSILVITSTFTVYCFVAGAHYVLTALTIITYYLVVTFWDKVVNRINQHNSALAEKNG